MNGSMLQIHHEEELTKILQQHHTIKKDSGVEKTKNFRNFFFFSEKAILLAKNLAIASKEASAA
jgi:hypothetical protein